MLYTYCFLSSPDDNLLLPQGLIGDLKLIEENAIAALVEPDLSREQLEANDEMLVKAVLHHDRVICELFRQTTVLPLRFGTYFHGQQELLSHLRANAQTYRQKLQALAGKVEVTLKLTPIPFSETDETPQETGKAYLKAKKQHYQKKTRYQTQQKEALQAFQGQISQTYPNVIQGECVETTERFHVLLNQTAFSLMNEQIEAWQKTLSSWKIEASEPLPPYHFL